MAKKQITGEATPQQIADWKAAHGDIFAYEADERVCYFRRPTRQVISAAPAVGSADPFKFTEIVIANCWLGGDEALRTEDRYFMGLSQKISEIVEIRVGEIKKL